MSALANPLKQNAPGVALAAAVAIAAVIAEPLLASAIRAATGSGARLPAMVIALIIGIGLFAVGARSEFQPGINWCVKKLLRIAIGLLGLRIALGDIAALGSATAALIIAAMAATIVSGFLLARLFGREPGFGALAGAATAVCGASAALATASVIPGYKNKDADTAFTVVMANAVSTLVMVAYPPLSLWLGLTSQETGQLLGATIHDMAQVVGAGYAVSESAGNSAVIVKLFRVFLLLPVVLAIGWWFTRNSGAKGAAEVPVPVFALVFLLLCVVNSIALAVPALAAPYAPVKALLVQASTWGLLISIGALGLGTSLSAILSIGWRHAAVFMGTTLVILIIGAGGIFLLR